jgi:hypothetical protein
MKDEEKARQLGTLALLAEGGGGANSNDEKNCDLHLFLFHAVNICMDVNNSMHIHNRRSIRSAAFTTRGAISLML